MSEHDQTVPAPAPRKGPGRPPKLTDKDVVEQVVETASEELSLSEVPTTPVTPVDATTPNPELEELRRELATLRAEREELETLRRDKEAREEASSTVAPKEGKFVIHFVRDGLTVLGKMTYRGQELEWDTNDQNYKDTCDRVGWSFLEMRRDAAAQEAYYGAEYFREGPWTGKSYADIKFELIKTLAGRGEDTNITADELAKLDQLDKKRRRKLDPLPPISGGSPVGRRSGY